MDFLAALIILLLTTVATSEPIIDVSTRVLQADHEFNVSCYYDPLKLRGADYNIETVALFKEDVSSSTFVLLAQFNMSPTKAIQNIPPTRKWDVEFGGLTPFLGLRIIPYYPPSIKLVIHDTACIDAGTYRCLAKYGPGEMGVQLSQDMNVTTLDADCVVPSANKDLDIISTVSTTKTTSRGEDYKRGYTIGLIMACWVIAVQIVVMGVLIYRLRAASASKKEDEMSRPAHATLPVLNASPNLWTARSNTAENHCDHSYVGFDTLETRALTLQQAYRIPPHYMNNPVYIVEDGQATHS